MPGADNQRLARLSTIFASFDAVRLALLFGSRVKGTATSGSDYDFAVDAPASVLADVGARISETLGAEVDVVRLEEASVPLLRELIRDSVVVYERAKGDGALWRSRVLAQLEIDGPWYDRMRDSWIARVAERGFGNGE